MLVKSTTWRTGPSFVQFMWNWYKYYQWKETKHYFQNTRATILLSKFQTCTHATFHRKLDQLYICKLWIILFFHRQLIPRKLISVYSELVKPRKPYCHSLPWWISKSVFNDKQKVGKTYIITGIILYQLLSRPAICTLSLIHIVKYKMIFIALKSEKWMWKN